MKKIRRMDGEYREKMKLAEQGVVPVGERDAQVLLAKHMKQMLGRSNFESSEEGEEDEGEQNGDAGEDNQQIEDDEDDEEEEDN